MLRLDNIQGSLSPGPSCLGPACSSPDLLKLQQQTSCEGTICLSPWRPAGIILPPSFVLRHRATSPWGAGLEGSEGAQRLCNTVLAADPLVLWGQARPANFGFGRG